MQLFMAHHFYIYLLFLLHFDMYYIYLLAASPLASRDSIFNEVRRRQKSSLHLFQVLNLEIKYPKTIPGPMWSFPKIKNSIGSIVIEILSYRHKNLITLYNSLLEAMLLEANRGSYFFVF